MKTEEEQKKLALKQELLKEIKYREEILTQLNWDYQREKGFVMNFIRGFLKIKTEAPNLFWKDGETYGRYLIDADKELNKDIQSAFEKSINKLKEDYEKSDVQNTSLV